MDYTKANALAVEKIGECVGVAYRNVWCFFPAEGEGKTVIVSKDESTAAKKSVFIEDEALGEIRDAESGECVTEDEVFGIPFYAQDPAIFTDTLTDSAASAGARIEQLLGSISAKLEKRGIPTVVLVMLYDLIEEENETSCKRLVALNNYLDKDISLTAEDISYLHHELYTLE